MPPGAATHTPPTSAAPTRFRTRPLSRDRGGDARSIALAKSMEAHQRAISVHQHAMLGDIAEFGATEAFRGDGALSMAAWLSDRCRLSASSARSLVAVADKVGRLPALFDALSDGRLTFDVLAPLATVATADNDAELAEAAVHWSVRQAKELVRAARGMSDGEAADTFAGRFVRFDDVRFAIFAQLTPDAYAIVKSTLVARATRHDHPSLKNPGYERFESRLADALVEVCIERGRKDGGSRDGATKNLGRDVDSSDSSSSAGRPLFGGAPAHLVVHADLSLLMGRDEVAGLAGEGTASIEGLGPIGAEIARRLSCDGTHTISVEAADGTILDQFPWRRSPTTAQRIEVARRDGGCRFPGCGYDLITNVHHLRHWIKGGPTVMSNLITLCAAHHSRVHELGWKMSGDANELVSFTSPHGRESISSPSPVWRRSLPMRK
jgi:hypothetical protein